MTFTHGNGGYHNHKCRCAICREGARLANEDYRKRHPGKHAAWNRKGAANARAKYPDKIRARNVIANLTRRGALTREPCEACGSMPTEAHHEDYSKPLDIRWLCRTCHTVEHLRVA